jgi:hypothetical protein
MDNPVFCGGDPMAPMTRLITGGRGVVFRGTGWPGNDMKDPYSAFGGQKLTPLEEEKLNDAMPEPEQPVQKQVEELRYKEKIGESEDVK